MEFWKNRPSKLGTTEHKENAIEGYGEDKNVSSTSTDDTDVDNTDTNNADNTIDPINYKERLEGLKSQHPKQSEASANINDTQSKLQELRDRHSQEPPQNLDSSDRNLEPPEDSKV